MFEAINRNSALLYGLSRQIIQQCSALHYINDCVKWGAIDDSDFLSLANHLRLAEKSEAEICITIEDGIICFETPEVKHSGQCSNVIDFQRESKNLANHYLFVLDKGVSVDSGFLSFVGDSWKSRKLLLQLQALTQDVSQWNLGNCWGLMIELGFGQETGAAETEELLFYLEDAVSAERNYDDGMIGQMLFFKRIGSMLTFSVAKDDLASCDVHDFMEALLELLVSYESAVKSGE